MPNEPEAPIRAISETLANLRLSRAARNEYEVTISAGTEPEALLQPEYWRHLAHRFMADWKARKTADILAVCEDRTWRAYYEIRDVGPLHLTLAIMKTDSDGVCRYGLGGLDDRAEETSDGYRIGFSPGIKYYVQRISDKEKIAKNCETREVTEARLEQHLKEIAA